MTSRLTFSGVRWITLVFLISMAVCAQATITVTLASSLASPQPVGTTITWTATVTDTAGGGDEMQFSVAPSGGPAAIVHDFNISKSFPWTPSASEGTYTISVVARNISTGTTATASKSFTATSLVVNGHAAVNPTKHPLVALFSTGSCTVPNSMRVRFKPTSTVPAGGITAPMTTNLVPCRDNPSSPDKTSMNFYIAGMYPTTTYNMHWETVDPNGTVLHVGTNYPFTTGPLPGNIDFPVITVPTPAMSPTSATAPILLHDYLPPRQPGNYFVPTATDLSGNVLWYYPLAVSLMPRTEVGGNAFIINITRGLTPQPYLQILREVDLAGHTLLETNAAAISEQLAKMTGPNGQPRRPINQFHHEARRLPNGYIAVMASDEMLVYNAQGGTATNPVDVLGAQVIVLDQNLQVVWAWDAYDFLDLNHGAIMNNQCTAGVGTGCPVFFLLPTANDWLHGNSIQQTPDGSLMISLRHVDWVIKINYAKGTGDGSVLWKMGYQGDFTLLNPPTSPNCTTPNQMDAYQWFTDQHDANFNYGKETILSVYDNGDLRIFSCDTGGHSRGYVLTVDEANLQATPLYLYDLGVYSVGNGTAERIPGTPNYHFESGWVIKKQNSLSSEIAPGGVVQSAMTEGDITYRSYRMQDLYTPAAQSH